MQLDQARLSHLPAIRAQKAHLRVLSADSEIVSIRHRDPIWNGSKLHTISSVARNRSFPSSAQFVEEFLDLCPLLSHFSHPSMASESSEKLEQTARTARRTETPPRSIFDDYHSAYQSILSSGRSLTGNSKAENAPDVRSGPSGLQLPTNPFANLPPLDHNSRNSSYSGQPGSVADVKDNRTSQRPRSPKARPRTNFSRPMSLSPSSGQVTRPAHAVVRNSVSIFDLGSPRTLSEKRSPNTKQPNLYGARGRVDKSSTIGSIVKKYGDEPKSNRRSTDSDHQVEVRSSLDILGCGRGTTELPSVQVRSSPAGQAPNIPLPPDPSYVAARGLAGEILSEASLYENTEKLLNLTQTSGGDALVRSASSDQIPHHLEDRLHSEFSWMGNRGMSSFRDLSVKELRQLPKSTHASARDVASKDVEDTPGGDESYDDQYLLTDAVYQPPVAVQRSDTLDNTAKENARRAEMLLDNLVTDLFEEAVEGSATDEVDVDTVEARGPVSGDARTDAGLDHGGLQSSSSRGASLEASLRDGPFRPGLYMDESSLVSLVGRESADAARRSAIAKGKMVVRSTEDNDEDGVHTVAGADENEGGEWETLGESGMRSKLGTQASIRRDTSGSSLANVSSIESTQNDRAAPSPWDPLRSHPVIVTPPNKAVVHPRRGGVSKVQEPATVPRYAAPGADQRISGALNTTSSSTPALTFPATPHNQKGRQNSPPYRHPTPLSHQHQNPFISSPPSVEAQAPGASYELTEFTDRGNEKRRAIYADSPRSLFQQIRKPTTPKSESRVNNPFTTQDTRSETSVDGSYSTTYPTNLAVDGSSILNPDSSRTPKSANSYTRGSIKRTKQYFTGSPRCMKTSINLHY